ILNFIGFNMLYLPGVQKAKSAKTISERKLKAAEMTLALREKYEPEMAWLERSGTVRTTPLEAQSKLQALLRKQASARRLEIRDSRIITYQPGEHFDRVKVLFKVTGMERDVLSWLTSIHQISQRQVITKMEVKPQNNDITRIEVEIEIEKWILPPLEEE
ncbi:MAG: hypothetical protein ABF391_00090, partial [Akkermansiaceae bacterium]